MSRSDKRAAIGGIKHRSGPKKKSLILTRW
jgi:hypothetical protein